MLFPTIRECNLKCIFWGYVVITSENSHQKNVFEMYRKILWFWGYVVVFVKLVNYKRYIVTIRRDVIVRQCSVAWRMWSWNMGDYLEIVAFTVKRVDVDLFWTA